MMPFDQAAELALRLGAATVFGGAIGLNRDLHGKPVGLRTLGLVALGAALSTLAVLRFDPGASVPVDAVSRVIQGVLVGVAFLGAGVIMRDEIGHPHRLNTATAIWVTAALGIACGLGAWVPAIITALLALLLLTVGARIDHWLFGRSEKTQDPKD